MRPCCSTRKASPKRRMAGTSFRRRCNRPAGNSSQVGDQRLANVVGGGRDLVLVVRVVDADGERGATLERGGHRRAQLEPQEMNGRGLDVVLPLQVFVGNGEQTLETG